MTTGSLGTYNFEVGAVSTEINKRLLKRTCHSSRFEGDSNNDHVDDRIDENSTLQIEEPSVCSPLRKKSFDPDIDYTTGGRTASADAGSIAMHKDTSLDMDELLASPSERGDVCVESNSQSSTQVVSQKNVIDYLAAYQMPDGFVVGIARQEVFDKSSCNVEVNVDLCLALPDPAGESCQLSDPTERYSIDDYDVDNVRDLITYDSSMFFTDAILNNNRSSTEVARDRLRHIQSFESADLLSTNYSQPATNEISANECGAVDNNQPLDDQISSTHSAPRVAIMEKASQPVDTSHNKRPGKIDSVLCVVDNDVVTSNENCDFNIKMQKFQFSGLKSRSINMRKDTVNVRVQEELIESHSKTSRNFVKDEPTPVPYVSSSEIADGIQIVTQDFLPSDSKNVQMPASERIHVPLVTTSNQNSSQPAFETLLSPFAERRGMFSTMIQDHEISQHDAEVAKHIVKRDSLSKLQNEQKHIKKAAPVSHAQSNVCAQDSPTASPVMSLGRHLPKTERSEKVITTNNHIAHTPATYSQPRNVKPKLLAIKKEYKSEYIASQSEENGGDGANAHTFKEQLLNASQESHDSRVESKNHQENYNQLEGGDNVRDSNLCEWQRKPAKPTKRATESEDYMSINHPINGDDLLTCEDSYDDSKEHQLMIEVPRNANKTRNKLQKIPDHCQSRVQIELEQFQNGTLGDKLNTCDAHNQELEDAIRNVCEGGKKRVKFCEIVPDCHFYTPPSSPDSSSESSNSYTADSSDDESFSASYSQAPKPLTVNMKLSDMGKFVNYKVGNEHFGSNDLTYEDNSVSRYVANEVTQEPSRQNSSNPTSTLGEIMPDTHSSCNKTVKPSLDGVCERVDNNNELDLVSKVSNTLLTDRNIIRRHMDNRKLETCEKDRSCYPAFGEISYGTTSTDLPTLRPLDNQDTITDTIAVKVRPGNTYPVAKPTASADSVHVAEVNLKCTDSPSFVPAESKASEVPGGSSHVEGDPSVLLRATSLQLEQGNAANIQQSKLHTQTINGDPQMFSSPIQQPFFPKSNSEASFTQPTTKLLKKPSSQAKNKTISTNHSNISHSQHVCDTEETVTLADHVPTDEDSATIKERGFFLEGAEQSLSKQKHKPTKSADGNVNTISANLTKDTDAQPCQISHGYSDKIGTLGVIGISTDKSCDIEMLVANQPSDDPRYMDCDEYNDSKTVIPVHSDTGETENIPGTDSRYIRSLQPDVRTSETESEIQITCTDILTDNSDILTETCNSTNIATTKPFDSYTHVGKPSPGLSETSSQSPPLHVSTVNEPELLELRNSDSPHVFDTAETSSNDIVNNQRRKERAMLEVKLAKDTDSQEDNTSLKSDIALSQPDNRDELHSASANLTVPLSNMQSLPLVRKSTQSAVLIRRRRNPQLSDNNCRVNAQSDMGAIKGPLRLRSTPLVDGASKEETPIHNLKKMVQVESCDDTLCDNLCNDNYTLPETSANLTVDQNISESNRVLGLFIGKESLGNNDTLNASNQPSSNSLPRNPTGSVDDITTELSPSDEMSNVCERSDIHGITGVIAIGAPSSSLKTSKSKHSMPISALDDECIEIVSNSPNHIYDDNEFSSDFNIHFANRLDTNSTCTPEEVHTLQVEHEKNEKIENNKSMPGLARQKKHKAAITTDIDDVEDTFSHATSASKPLENNAHKEATDSDKTKKRTPTENYTSNSKGLLLNAVDFTERDERNSRPPNHKLKIETEHRPRQMILDQYKFNRKPKRRQQQGKNNGVIGVRHVDTSLLGGFMSTDDIHQNCDDSVPTNLQESVGKTYSCGSVDLFNNSVLSPPRSPGSTHSSCGALQENSAGSKLVNIESLSIKENFPVSKMWSDSHYIGGKNLDPAVTSDQKSNKLLKIESLSDNSQPDHSKKSHGDSHNNQTNQIVIGNSDHILDNDVSGVHQGYENCLNMSNDDQGITNMPNYDIRPIIFPVLNETNEAGGKMTKDHNYTTEYANVVYENLPDDTFKTKKSIDDQFSQHASLHVNDANYVHSSAPSGLDDTRLSQQHSKAPHFQTGGVNGNFRDTLKNKYMFKKGGSKSRGSISTCSPYGTLNTSSPTLTADVDESSKHNNNNNTTNGSSVENSQYYTDTFSSNELAVTSMDRHSIGKRRFGSPLYSGGGQYVKNPTNRSNSSARGAQATVLPQIPLSTRPTTEDDSVFDIQHGYDTTQLQRSLLSPNLEMRQPFPVTSMRPLDETGLPNHIQRRMRAGTNAQRKDTWADTASAHSINANDTMSPLPWVAASSRQQQPTLSTDDLEKRMAFTRRGLITQPSPLYPATIFVQRCRLLSMPLPLPQTYNHLFRQSADTRVSTIGGRVIHRHLPPQIYSYETCV